MISGPKSVVRNGGGVTWGGGWTARSISKSFCHEERAPVLLFFLGHMSGRTKKSWLQWGQQDHIQMFFFQSFWLGHIFQEAQATKISFTLPESNVAPENQWLEDDSFPFGTKRPIFRADLAVSFGGPCPVQASIIWNEVISIPWENSQGMNLLEPSLGTPLLPTFDGDLFQKKGRFPPPRLFQSTLW